LLSMKGQNLVTIKVASKTTARPLINKSVSLGISDFLSGGFTNQVHTDSNGEVHFDIEPCNGAVYVGEQEIYMGRIAGRILLYV